MAGSAGLTNFIPQIWAARAAYYLERSLVFASPNVVNREYEGEIRAAGDTVKINQIGDISVNDYVPGTNITVQSLASAQTLLTIDQKKVVAFEVDDVDTVQSQPKLIDLAMERSAYALQKTVDTDLATIMSDGVAEGNVEGTTGSPVSITTGALAYQYLVALSVILDEADVPEQGRFAIVPPWYYGLLLRETAFVSAGTAATDTRLITGVISQALGMTIYKSNAIVNTAGTAYKVLAGSNIATTMAMQVPASSMEALRRELQLSTMMRGLLLYGRKVTHPNALAMLICNKT